MSRPAEDDERAEGRIEPLERVGEAGEAEDGERGAADGPDEATDLREGARAAAEERADDDQQDRDQVERVHRPIVAQAPDSRRMRDETLGARRSGPGGPAS